MSKILRRLTSALACFINCLLFIYCICNLLPQRGTGKEEVSDVSISTLPDSHQQVENTPRNVQYHHVLQLWMSQWIRESRFWARLFPLLSLQIEVCVRLWKSLEFGKPSRLKREKLGKFVANCNLVLSALLIALWK